MNLSFNFLQQFLDLAGEDLARLALGGDEADVRHVDLAGVGDDDARHRFLVLDDAEAQHVADEQLAFRVELVHTGRRRGRGEGVDLIRSRLWIDAARQFGIGDRRLRDAADGEEQRAA